MTSRTARRVTFLFGLATVAGLTGCLTPTAYTGPAAAAPRQQLPPAVEKPRAMPRPDTILSGQVVQASAVQPEPVPQPKKTTQPKALEVPPGLPGAEIPPQRLPPDTPETKAARQKAIAALFPDLPDPGPEPLVDGEPGAVPITLEELTQIALRQNPAIVQARADIEIARGQWVQAGLYPNPTIGAQGDQVADGGPFGQFGGYFNQTIITAGKLKLARAVSFFDFLNAQLRLRKAEVDLKRQVRADYFAALVAAENVRVTRLVSAFTEEVYNRQMALLRTGNAAAFEASALRAVVGQVRTNLIQARQRYVSAWKQLAATLNAADMPPAPLAGRVDMPIPRYRYDVLRDRMLATHTDLGVARNQLAQAEQTLVLERRRPVPDLQNNFYVEKDTQTASLGLPSVQFGYQVGVSVPLWNRNQGAIMTAAAQIARLSREQERVRIDLTRQLADAFERYETARQQLALYRDQILPDLVQAFRGVYQRYQVEPDKVNYNDIVTAQQNLANQLINYLQALQQQWQAVSDLAGIVQADDLFELSKELDRAAPDTWPETGPKPPPVPQPQPLPEPKPVP
jgi:cobalt-zinc-cadmium efflux system outer membrane protein